MLTHADMGLRRCFVFNRPHILERSVRLIHSPIIGAQGQMSELNFQQIYAFPQCLISLYVVLSDYNEQQMLIGPFFTQIEGKKHKLSVDQR